MVLKVNHIAIVQSEMVHYIDQKVPVPLTGLGVKVVASQPEHIRHLSVVYQYGERMIFIQCHAII